MRHTTRYAALALAGALALAACGGGDDNDTATPAAQASTTVVATIARATTPTTALTATTAASATTTTTAAPAVNKPNANTASRAEMTAAFTTAGISNAARWAMEVEEYRPYPSNDPTMAKLRQNLVKYNPGPGVVDGIVSALSL